MIQTLQWEERQGREKVMVARREKRASYRASVSRMCLNVVFMSRDGDLSMKDMTRLPVYRIRTATLRSEQTRQSCQTQPREKVTFSECYQSSQHNSSSPTKPKILIVLSKSEA